MTEATIRTKLLKISAQIRVMVRKVWVSMASSYPWPSLYPQVWSNLRSEPVKDLLSSDFIQPHRPGLDRCVCTAPESLSRYLTNFVISIKPDTVSLLTDW
jgi:hypothetical protein